jgi:hypothetical protein
MCKKATFHKDFVLHEYVPLHDVVLLNVLITPKKAPKLLRKKLEFRQIAVGDKFIFFPHSVDNIMPDKRLYSHGHNQTIPKLLTSNPQITWHLSPTSPQPCPQQVSRLTKSRCINRLIKRKFHELKLSR